MINSNIIYYSINSSSRNKIWLASILKLHENIKTNFEENENLEKKIISLINIVNKNFDENENLKKKIQLTLKKISISTKKILLTLLKVTQ